LTGSRPNPRPALFPSFFLGGFECATQVDRSRRRQDFIILTDHEYQVREDYERALSMGIRTIREGLRWHLIDKGGRYDFSSIEPMVDAANDLGITLINCLFHYGYPDDLDPLSTDFVKRMADYAAAYAQWRVPRVPGPRWYGIVNEPSMLAYAAGSAGWFAPFLKDKQDELLENLLRASLAAGDAINKVDPESRFMAIDPVVHVVPGEEDSQEEADKKNEGQYHFLDMLCGRDNPGLGGAPGYLDVIGVNAYPDSQFEADGTPLGMDDPRRKPFREMLMDVWTRYGRPVIVAETSARGLERPGWHRMMVDECIAAMEAGVDLQGICIYPLVDMPEWKHGVVGPLGKLGLWDVAKQGERLRRVLNEAYACEVLAAQRRVEDSGVAPVVPCWQPARSRTPEPHRNGNRKRSESGVPNGSGPVKEPVGQTAS
jgi:beta-glucosidase/6-phospho-beta-glucosidase/beta-galactosidase